MKKLLTILAVVGALLLPGASAQPVVDATGGGVPQSNITNTATSIPNTSTAVTLVAGSHHLCINNTSSTTTLYVDLANGTATSADFPIPPGAGMTWDNLPLITTFKVIGSAASGTFGVTAW